MPHWNEVSKIYETKLTEFQEETDKFMVGMKKSTPFSLKLLLHLKNKVLMIEKFVWNGSKLGLPDMRRIVLWARRSIYSFQQNKQALQINDLVGRYHRSLTRSSTHDFQTLCADGSETRLQTDKLEKT